MHSGSPTWLTVTLLHICFSCNDKLNSIMSTHCVHSKQGRQHITSWQLSDDCQKWQTQFLFFPCVFSEEGVWGSCEGKSAVQQVVLHLIRAATRGRQTHIQNSMTERLACTSGVPEHFNKGMWVSGGSYTTSGPSETQVDPLEIKQDVCDYHTPWNKLIPLSFWKRVSNHRPCYGWYLTPLL